MEPFEEVVAEHGPAVLRVCRALLGAADADDAWSETFLAALRAYPDLRPGSDARAWLVTIAHNKAIDQIRAATRAEARSSRATAAETVSLPEPPDDGLRAAVAALPPKQRGAVVYRYLADLPYAEVAALLDSNEAAARRSAADGIATLRRTYERGPGR